MVIVRGLDRLDLPCSGDLGGRQVGESAFIIDGHGQPGQFGRGGLGIYAGGNLPSRLSQRRLINGDFGQCHRHLCRHHRRPNLPLDLIPGTQYLIPESENK